MLAAVTRHAAQLNGRERIGSTMRQIHADVETIRCHCSTEAPGWTDRAGREGPKLTRRRGTGEVKIATDAAPS